MFKYRLFTERRKDRYQEQLNMPKSAKAMLACLQIALGAHFLGIAYTEQEVPVTYGAFLLFLVGYLYFAGSSLRRVKRVSQQSGFRKEAKRFWPVHNLLLLYLGSRLSKKERGEVRRIYYLQRFSDLILAMCVCAVLPMIGKRLFYKIVFFQYIYYRFFEG